MGGLLLGACENTRGAVLVERPYFSRCNAFVVAVYDLLSRFLF